MKEQVTACIDGSALSAAVCDAAAWASTRLQCPLQLLHVLEKSVTPILDDLSGTIGPDETTHLLNQLTELDERRNKLAIEHGKRVLAEARARALEAGVREVHLEQRHESLLDALLGKEAVTRLYVLGRKGTAHADRSSAIGSNVENLVRAVSTPLLITTETFRRPQRFMMAYDGSPTGRVAIEKIAASDLLKGIPGDLVMVGEDNRHNRESVRWARNKLEKSGLVMESHLLQGEVMETLRAFEERHAVDLKVMGAYGHSRIREWIVGSHTTRMIASSTMPVLVLR